MTEPIPHVIATPHPPAVDAMPAPSADAVAAWELEVAAGAVLSNGAFSVTLAADGTGGARLGGLSVTRGSARHGTFVFLRDLDSGVFWSIGAATAAGSGSFRASPGRATIHTTHNGIESTLEVCVAPDAPVELRRVTVRNPGAGPRRIELTSYAEIVLNDRRADLGHPAFSKLFVETEWDPQAGALLARRRPRAPEDVFPLAFHALAELAVTEWETDRVRFVGRGSTLARPHALREPAALSGTTGRVLDPIVSLRGVFALAPAETAAAHLVTGVAADRAEALEFTARFAGAGSVDRAFDGAVAAERARLAAQGWSTAEAPGLQALLIALDRGTLPRRAIGGAPRIGRAALSAAAMSVARSLVVVHTTDAAATETTRRAWRYWRSLGLAPQLLMLGATSEESAAPRPGDEEAPVVRPAARFTPAEASGIDALAGLVIDASWPRVSIAAPGGSGGRSAARFAAPPEDPAATPAPEPLRFFNGHGGFSADGREYVIRVPAAGAASRLPPLPWVNVIANPGFGTIVSETGAGCTWSSNSRERRITPWHNDPLLDPHGEAIYLHDDASGAVHSVFPGPVPPAAPCEVRHGIGYSTFSHAADGLEVEATVFVAAEAPVKLVRIRLRSRASAPRRLALLSVAQLDSGDDGPPRFSRVEWDEGARAQAAHDPGGDGFAASVAFAAWVPAPSPPDGLCGTDLAEALGPQLDWERPAFLTGDGIPAGTATRGTHPCFAQRVALEIAPGATAQVTFLLGEEADQERARAIVTYFRAPGAVDAEFERVRREWLERVSAIEVETPSPAIDLMVGGWLAYQTLSCRIWGRTATYQSGGAFGFRDQLQDAVALVAGSPELARAQILLHAAHQFVEGDVLHWWHPPADRGIRTRFADDRLWLPWLAARYVAVTGDRAVLDERVPFLRGPALAPGEDEILITPLDAGVRADLYEHCCRAIDCSLNLGEHGLPLFGGGDWNDGMNRVGVEGRGESVWMAMFLATVIADFSRWCEARGDLDRLARYRRHRERLVAAINDAGWDGTWYRRGYYDDGSPLGSRDSDECRIDALVQAWAVLSGSAPPERAALALEEAERHLVSEAEGVIRLLTPPFEHTTHDPGYIRGYVAGVRENGGQYTHAALWLVRALAEHGRRDRAARLLEMLSPVTATATPAAVARYRAEPYVVAADVYGAPPHVGRAGWSWYTGSSGWMLRVAVESILGIEIADGNTLRIAPRIPDDWPGFRVRLRLPGDGTRCVVRVRNPHGRAQTVVEATAMGRPIPIVAGVAVAPLARDGGEYTIDVVLGPAVGGTA